MEEITVNFQRRVRELSTTLPSSLQGPLGRWGSGTERKGRNGSRAFVHLSWCAFALTLLLRATWLEETIRALDLRVTSHQKEKSHRYGAGVTGEIGLKRLSVQSECRTLGYQPNSYSRSDQVWAGGLLASNAHGSLSSLKPANFECRRWASGVHSANSICSTSSGVRMAISPDQPSESTHRPATDQKKQNLHWVPIFRCSDRYQMHQCGSGSLICSNTRCRRRC